MHVRKQMRYRLVTEHIILIGIGIGDVIVSNVRSSTVLF